VGVEIEAIVVTYDSAAVVDACLASLAASAPEHGIGVWVVDNASRDESARLAEARLGTARVVRQHLNRGFAAGVNAGLKRVSAPFVAVINPDVVLPAGALDRLAVELERHPRGGLIAPRVVDEGGQAERSVGRLPTLAGEWIHALYLERLFGLPGRHMRFPDIAAPVGWVSGCAWLLRRSAVVEVGELDESYFMYYEDSDYCRRLHDAGWDVLATPVVTVTHRLGRGSTSTGGLPADGGIGVLRYFRKFSPGVDERLLKTGVMMGWRIRLWSHRVRSAFGSRRSRDWVTRFDRSLRMMRDA
jgi:GT2 family glycosyltransferase